MMRLLQVFVKFAAVISNFFNLSDNRAAFVVGSSEIVSVLFS